MNPSPPRMYDDLAAWWPLLSPPSDYEEEADDYPFLLRDPDGSVRAEHDRHIEGIFARAYSIVGGATCLSASDKVGETELT